MFCVCTCIYTNLHTDTCTYMYISSISSIMLCSCILYIPYMHVHVVGNYSATIVHSCIYMCILVFRDVMCLPALKQHVYSALHPKAEVAMATVEARLNVMQTVFLTLQSQPGPAHDPSESLFSHSQKIFQTLFNRHFDEDMEVGTC